MIICLEISHLIHTLLLFCAVVVSVNNNLIGYDVVDELKRVHDFKCSAFLLPDQGTND